MLQMPEFDVPVRPTLPMAEGRASPRAPSGVARPPLARRLAWITLGLVACAGLALLFVAVGAGRFAPWRSEAPPEAPSSAWIPLPQGQGGAEPVTTTTPPEEPQTSPPPEPERPPAQSSRGGASSKPSAPTPPPSPTPPQPTLPSPTPPQPTLPSPAPPLPLPQLPWSLPTAGACERCLQALRGSGHYTVVSAAAEALLCEDHTARANCERELDEAAPAVAERAAREGNCTAALATVAAVSVRVPPERFAAVNALCLR